MKVTMRAQLKLQVTIALIIVLGETTGMKPSNSTMV